MSCSFCGDGVPLLLQSPCDKDSCQDDGTGHFVTACTFCHGLGVILTRPDPPQNLVLTPGDKKITMTWEEPDGNGGSPITGYKVQRGIEGISAEVIKVDLGPNVFTYTWSGLKNGEIYTFYVWAVNAVGESFLRFGGAAPEAPATPPHSHAWRAAWKTNAASHWKECACGAKSGLTAHTPSAAATCTAAQTCKVCSAVLAPATGHTPGAAATCMAAQTCKVCTAELAPTTGHTPGEAATCMAAQTCTVCSAELAPTTGHTPGEAATCTAAQACTVCSGELAPAKGHTPGAAATCTAAQACTVCSAELVPAAGHTPGDWIVDKAATTKVEGSRHKECTACGYVTAAEAIPVVPTYVRLFGLNTSFSSTPRNWFKFIALFGFIWMWFI